MPRGFPRDFLQNATCLRGRSRHSHPAMHGLY
jgi:hypothetical protein